MKGEKKIEKGRRRGEKRLQANLGPTLSLTLIAALPKKRRKLEEKKKKKRGGKRKDRDFTIFNLLFSEALGRKERKKI